MDQADKVRLAQYDREADKITGQEWLAIMTDVMSSQARSYRWALYDRQGHDTSMNRWEDVHGDILNSVRIDQGGYLMSEEEMDDYDPNTYMVTDEWQWFCRVEGTHEYTLYNGEWTAYVVGDTSEILYGPQGHADNKTVKVTDWREVKGSEMLRLTGAYFYRPIEVPEEEDDINF